MYTVLTAVILVAAGANEQSLVLFYAVPVFLSFLAGRAAMVTFSCREGRWGSLVLNVVGTLVIAFVLAINLARGLPLVSPGAALLIAASLYWPWSRNGRPCGISGAGAEE